MHLWANHYFRHCFPLLLRKICWMYTDILLLDFQFSPFRFTNDSDFGVVDLIHRYRIMACLICDFEYNFVILWYIWIIFPGKNLECNIRGKCWNLTETNTVYYMGNPPIYLQDSWSIRKLEIISGIIPFNLN